MDPRRPLAGIFIGGAARRFGGVAKGLLETPDGRGRVVERLKNLCIELDISPVFVGSDARYDFVSLLTIPDRRGSEGGQKLGPLGGLLALYEHAAGRRTIVLACDMPFVSRGTLERLLATDAPLAAARRDGFWEPFLSVHDPHIMKPRAEANLAGGRLSLQALFDGAEEIAIDAHELDDWDSPDDVARTMPMRTMS